MSVHGTEQVITIDQILDTARGRGIAPDDIVVHVQWLHTGNELHVRVRSAAEVDAERTPVVRTMSLRESLTGRSDS